MNRYITVIIIIIIIHYYNYHFCSVTEENKLPDGSGNAGVCENPQAGVGAVAGKKPVCVKALLQLLLILLLISCCIFPLELTQVNYLNLLKSIK